MMSATDFRLMIIDDNPDYGGHQVMSAYALEGLLRWGSANIVLLLNPKNKKSLARFSEIQRAFPERLQIQASPTRSRKFQAVRRYFETNRIQHLLSHIQEYGPDLLIVIQGNIEQGSSIFRLHGRIRCPMISYIPVPHKHAEMGAKLGAVRDLTCRSLYQEPDGFITISQTLAEMLRHYGTKGKIEVVENGIPLEPFKSLPDRLTARDALGIPQNVFIWGQIGRTEFNQKGQDFALQLFRARSNTDECLVFLGSGPDSERLAVLCQGLKRVYCLPWMDEPAGFYPAIDALLLPSRYEGVPLAMLEALANGVPVAAVDRDGMCDWLPQPWRFKYRNINSGLAAMDAVKVASPAAVESLRSRVWDHHSIDSFQHAFRDAVYRWLD